MTDNFLWLINWFRYQCNGDWEHSSGIRLETMDNPGWSITINLEDTELENKIFEKIKQDSSEENWLICFVQNKKFEGRCGTANLLEVLEIFRRWAESCEQPEKS